MEQKKKYKIFSNTKMFLLKKEILGNNANAEKR